MLPRRIAFLGGNGHCAARLAAARRHLPAEIDLLDVPYPGFEGRPRARDFEKFLDAVGAHLREAAPHRIYAMGIGGLLALCLRARGDLLAAEGRRIFPGISLRAIVNCAGIYKAIAQGDRLRLDGGRGRWRW